jgi:MFS family permease
MNPDKNLPSAQLVLILTTTTSFMTAFMGSSLNIALPVIGKEFNASALLLSWLSTIYLLSTAALLLPIGRFSDIKGRIKFFKSGVILFSAGSILSALSFNPELLLLPGVYKVLVLLLYSVHLLLSWSQLIRFLTEVRHWE